MTSPYSRIVADFELFNEIDFADKRDFNNVLSSVIAGCMLLMALYNLFMYFQLRSLTYVIYALNAVSIMLFMSVLPMGIIRYLPMSDLSYMIVLTISLTGTLILPLWFCYRFIEVHKHKVMSRWYLGVICFLFIYPVYAIFDIQSASKIAPLLGLVAINLLLISGSILAFRGSRPARFYLVAWAPYLVGSMYYSAYNMGALEAGLISQWAMPAGALAELFLISLGMADKVRQTEKRNFREISELNTAIKSEKEKIVELNESLEIKVEERTAELSSKTRDISTMLVNIEQGIFTITEDFAIHPEYSKYLENIFGTEEIAGPAV